MPIAAPEQIAELSYDQFTTVYNFLSFVIASMLFTALYLVISQRRVLPRYRNALVISAIVCGIAAYHYFRIFDSFNEAYKSETAGDGPFTLQAGAGFNEGYRYVDWLLTVPLLLLETIAVLALARSVSQSLMVKLIPAAIAMIALGYPGEISSDVTTKVVWGVLSTIPFLYILYVLFVELGKSMDRQPPTVRKLVSNLRLLLLATWGVYPISYALPLLNIEGADAFVGRQIGYSIADVLAKALFGIIIFNIARIKSEADDPTYMDSELEAPIEKKERVAT